MLDDTQLAAVAHQIDPLLTQLDEMKKVLDARRPLDSAAVARLEHAFEVDFVYNSNAIEGSKLTRRETELVLSRGITIGAHPIRDHLEAANLAGAHHFVRELAQRDHPFSEMDLLELHKLVLKDIEGERPGYYRSVAVRISGSDHGPPEPVLIPEQISAFLAWLRGPHSVHPVLVAAGAHWWISNIHPFHDGNGRVARLISNFLLLKNGYPIAIIKEEDRAAYYDALSRADGGDFSDFSEFIATSALRTARAYDRALSEQKRAEDLLGGIVASVSRSVTERDLAYYQAWKARMEGIKVEFQSATSYLDRELSPSVRFLFEDFGVIDFEKFQSLLRKGKAELTWFFKIRIIQVTGHERSFVFWFSWANSLVETFTRRPSLVSLHVSERRGGEWRPLVGPGLPSLREIFEHQNGVFQRSWVDRTAKLPPCSAVEPAVIASTFLQEATQSMS